MSQVLELQKDVNELREQIDKLSKSAPAQETSMTPKGDPIAELKAELESLKGTLSTPKKREVNLSYETDNLKILAFATVGALATPMIGAAINSVLPQVPASAESFIVGMIGYGLTYKKANFATGIFMGMIVTSAALLLQAIVGALIPSLQTVTQNTNGAFTL